MKKKIYLQISAPCHEDWNAMSPVQQGRFCGSCCKQVIDFSQMSDAEVLQVLTKNAGNTCGRFKADQLDRPMIREIPYSLRPYKFFAAAFIPALMITGAAFSQDRLQGKVAVNTTQCSSSFTKGDTVMQAVAEGKLKGKVTVADGSPAAGASIMLKGTNTGSVADAQGNFNLSNLPAGNKKLQLRVSSVGYESKEVRVDLTRQQEVSISLTPSAMGEVVITVGNYSAAEWDEDFVPVKKLKRKAAICGQVVDAQGQPLPYASITSSDDRKGVAADSSGRFTMPMKRNKKPAEIVASYTGYEPIRKQVSFDQDDTAAVIITLTKQAVLEPVSVVSYMSDCTLMLVGAVSMVTPVTLADTAKAMTAKVFRNEMFKVYPNPVVKGSELHIAFKQPGSYTIHLLDNAGKLYQSQKIVVTYKEQPSVVRLPIGLTPGQYFIKAVNQQTKKQFADKIIIQ